MAPISYHVQSLGTAAPGSMPSSYLAHEPSAIPNPVTTISPVLNLNISQSCCCAWEACTFFLVFRIAPGAKRPETYFQKMLRPHSKRPGASFYVCKNIALDGAFVRIVTGIWNHLWIVYQVQTCSVTIPERAPLAPLWTLRAPTWTTPSILLVGNSL